MPAISSIVHSGPSTIIQGEKETEVTCCITVTRRVIGSSSEHLRSARAHWTGDFSSISRGIDEAPGTPTYLRLPNGETHEIAIKNVTTNTSGVTLGEFYGRGTPPLE